MLIVNPEQLRNYLNRTAKKRYAFVPIERNEEFHDYYELFEGDQILETKKRTGSRSTSSPLRSSA